MYNLLLSRVHTLSEKSPGFAVKPKKEKEYLTLKELCGVMEITQKTFYVNRMAEQIPAYKFGKSIKYKKKDIEKFRI